MGAVCGGVLAFLQRPADGDAPCHSGAVPVPAGAHPPPVVFPGQRGMSIPQAGCVLLGFSAAYLLCRLLTLSLLEYLLSGAAALPGLYDVLAILFLSAVGLLIGAASKKKHLT